MFDDSCGYMIEKVGEGRFGKAAQCRKLHLDEEKVVIKTNIFRYGRHELAMLKKLDELDQDKTNLIRLNRHFKHRGHICLEFQLLVQVCPTS